MAVLAGVWLPAGMVKADSLAKADQAVSAGQNAGKAILSIETDRTQYSGTEPIRVTVKAANNLDCSMSHITVNTDVPEGYATEQGEQGQWVCRMNDISAGETGESTTLLVKRLSESPEAGTDPGVSPSENGGTKPEAGAPSLGKGRAAQTGDGSYRGFLCEAGTLGACFAVAVILWKSRKNRKDCLGILLPFLTAGIAVSCLYMPVRATGADEGTLVEHTEQAGKTIWIDGEEVELKAVMTYRTNEEKKEQTGDLSYEGYHLEWEDLFESDSLNRDDWNVEQHEPGWVNNERQAYVDSPQNIYIENGNLVLKPVEIRNEDGSKSYTSGRVNTQNKHDFKYGLFEARAKVPRGKGFLPAFWMMPTNENLYGQWPRCGEIDIMEVLGNRTDTSYGTIHYGNPHSESQGKYTPDTGDFADEYHVFTAEWEPGRIRWYVDGKLIHTENKWYSATEGQGEITYPAPFDQPFYMILNLAVGGNWPGDPDETTDIRNSAYYIDYVRVYQKDHYDENVKKLTEQVILREPDENGNYIINGDFAADEDLTDGESWKFLTALGGAANAKIGDGRIGIYTDNEGTADYSVQLVQPNIPMKQGGVYRLSFEASADADRAMKVNVSAPDRSFRRYLSDTEVRLTPEEQKYVFEFTMTDRDDANARVEFNMGAGGSTETIRISHVVLQKIDQISLTDRKKGVLADGNYVYNGQFQEGEDRLKYWDVLRSEGAQVTVTNTDNVRRLCVYAPAGTTAQNPVTVIQKDTALLPDGAYAVSFAAEGEAGKKIHIKIAGQSHISELSGSEEKYAYSLKVDKEPSDSDVAFIFEEPGVYYVDEVRVEEDRLIKNGSFDAGFSGYDPYVDSSISAGVSYVIDGLQEDNAADFTIGDTGDAAWKIQLKQNNVRLEKGQWYRLSLSAKASIPRKLMFALQKDGTTDNDWTPYAGEKIVDLGKEYDQYEILFQMKGDTDPKAVLSISMGAVAGIRITEKHRVCIDQIRLEKIDADMVSAE